MKFFQQICIFTILLLHCYGCSKNAFLAAKPDNSLVTPTAVSDYQRVLDEDIIMNGSLSGLTPGLLLNSEDNYFIPTNIYNANLIQITKNGYLWADNPYPAQTVDAWDAPYTCVYYSNFVLDGLAALPVSSYTQDVLSAKASALFYRSNAFYFLAQTFAAAYDSSLGAQQPGIPLVLQADVNVTIQRATIQQSYDRIITDLKEASTHLPALQQTYPTRPSQCACFGLLARVYQTMRRYDSAAFYANAALQIKNTLMDYNDFSTGTYHFPRFGPEVIFHCISKAGANPYGNIDTLLYNSYDSNDLRKVYFFDRSRTYNKFIGSYSGASTVFSGLATDELYLIRAECFARSGNATAAMNDLNTLLAKRFKRGSFIAYAATTAQTALGKVLQERRKELCFRALRSTDIRRLNQEGAGIAIQRVINGQTYTLQPGSPKWVWPIPDNVLSFNPGMQQNPR